MKPFASSLRYGFFDSNSSYLMIVNTNLSVCQIVYLLRVLRLYRKAIAYTIDDLQEVHPSVCVDDILMEDDISPES